MALAAGARLGPYEVLGLIGAGGMGEVYKAKDTRLDRTVAIKILPPDISSDPDRRSRFEREAKAIATLSHPHICTLHDVGEQSGSLFLVMEHLEGQTLDERLHKGALPIDEAIDYGAQIADALSTAHRRGIIHRDLKPANVMLTKSGVKLLDFGLAKLTGHGEQGATTITSAATRTASLTGQGAIVGTLQYMAPEQLEGRQPDARTDLWALATVIYEMVAGQRPFVGSTAASLIGAILEREPLPLAAVQPLVPPGLDRLVRRCLSKSADDRPDTAHDVADELRWMREPTVGDARVGRHQDGRPSHRARLGWWAGAMLVLGAVLLLAFLFYREREQNNNLRLVAADAFYQMRALDADLVELRSRGPASSSGLARASHRRASLEQEYDRYLDAIGLYAGKSPTERAVMRMARRLGETDLQVPRDFYESAMTAVAAWRESAPSLGGALDRARERNLLQNIHWALDTHGLPKEFLFLALQESRFEADAIGRPSRSGIPKGLWQLTPELAARYGLKLGPLVAVSRFDPVDERQDAERSTEAAVRYLSDLYWRKAAGSGLLVIASYNLGDRVLEKLEELPNDPRERSFWNLRKLGWLSGSTSEYVMSIFAAALICEQPEVFDVQIKPCY